MKEKYVEAGKIASKVREDSKKLLKKGSNVYKIVQRIEKEIHKKGGEMAFPVNVSINEYAAHDTAVKKSSWKLEKGDVVKIDLGVHIDGYIADTAYTKEIGTKKYSKMIKANKKALEKAIKKIEPGVKVREIGKVVAETAEENGFKPIKNLNGHSLEQWTLHAGLNIPNYDNEDDTVIEDGMVLAIEPFFTDGAGEVVNSGKKKIFRLEKSKPVRLPKVRSILKYIKKNFRGLPFTKAWLEDEFGKGWINISIPILAKSGSLKTYPALKEKEDGVITQFEHTIGFFDGEKVVTTR